MLPKFVNREAKVKTIEKFIASSKGWLRYDRWIKFIIKLDKNKQTPNEEKEEILLKVYNQLITAENCNKNDQEFYFEVMQKQIEKYRERKKTCERLRNKVMPLKKK